LKITLGGDGHLRAGVAREREACRVIGPHCSVRVNGVISRL